MTIPLEILTPFLVGFAAASMWRHERAYRQGRTDERNRINAWRRDRERSSQ